MLQLVALEEPVNKLSVQNVVEYLLQDVGDFDAIQIRDLQKKLMLLALPNGPLNKSVDRK